MLQDIKKLQASKTAKILTAFLILHKKKKQLLIFLTMLTQTDYIIISIKYRHSKKNKAWKTEYQKTDAWLGILCKAVKTKH